MLNCMQRRVKMYNYKISLKLLSETIFGSGHSIPGSVDLEIVCDDYGIPYMRAKTFKGNLREHMEKTNHLLDNKYKLQVNTLLGEEGEGTTAYMGLRFSDCKLKKSIKQVLEYGVRLNTITAEELKESLTKIRYFTSIDEKGKTIKGSLRQMRVIKKGLEFEIDLLSEEELTVDELGLLAISLRSLRHIGSMRTRGKGEVDCKLLIEEEGKLIDKTDFYIGKVLERGGIQ